jgi:hypothetical protein
LCCYVASVYLRHHYVQQDQIRPEIPRTLMSLGSVVLFQDEVVADLFEQDFDQVGAVPVVINNQDASLFFQHRPRHTYSFERQPPCGGVPLIFLQAKARVKYPEDRPFQR